MVRNDPKHLAFTLARYKFAAKMLTGSKRVLEIGCADAFASILVRQVVGYMRAIDEDHGIIDAAIAHAIPEWPIDFVWANFMETDVTADGFDGIVCLDVLEHISPSDENRFLSRLVSHMTESGVAVIGSPTLQGQAYASPTSKIGHINCKDQKAMRETFGRYFRNVFMFSMNDEVVHTGFGPMAHYNIALCCGPR